MKIYLHIFLIIFMLILLGLLILVVLSVYQKMKRFIRVMKKDLLDRKVKRCEGKLISYRKLTLDQTAKLSEATMERYEKSLTFLSEYTKKKKEEEDALEDTTIYYSDLEFIEKLKGIIDDQIDTLLASHFQKNVSIGEKIDILNLDVVIKDVSTVCLSMLDDGIFSTKSLFIMKTWLPTYVALTTKMKAVQTAVNYNSKV